MKPTPIIPVGRLTRVTHTITHEHACGYSVPIAIVTYKPVRDRAYWHAWLF